MAIITKAGRLHRFLPKKFPFIEILKYVDDACSSQSPAYVRMQNMKPGESSKLFIADGVYVIEQKFITKLPSECLFESHRKYVDIQLMLNGQELMGHTDIGSLQMKNPYDSEKDIMFYRPYENGHKFFMFAGDVAVFFPEDAHQVNQAMNQPIECIKPVIKIPLTYFEG